MRPINDLKRYANLHVAKLIDSLETPDDDGLNEDEKEFIHQEYKKIAKRVSPDHEEYGPEFLEEIDRKANEPNHNGRVYKRSEQ